MEIREIIEKSEHFARAYMSDKEAGHNWWHIERVRENALYIWNREKRGNRDIIELGSLLHDIGDDKIDPETDGSALVGAFLNDLKTDRDIVESVLEIMAKISFRDNFDSRYERSPELDIVQDADRLDAIGAIGIARAFNYGGSKGSEIYDPDEEIKRHSTKREYTSSGSSTISHFYEKLLLLAGKMNTETGKQLAAGRHRYMELFLEQFYKEWRME